MLAPLPASPSKSDEIAHYNAFINALPPGSYLHSMLVDTVGVVADNIRNDFAFDPLSDILAKKREVTAELQEMGAKLRDLKEQARVAERQKDRMVESIAELRREARRIAG